MHTLDKLRDALESEIMHQTMYNKYMIDIANPEVRQLFTQLRDGKMQHVTQLQQEVQRMMQQGTTG